MTRLSTAVRIEAPQERVWMKIADLGAIQDYHPGVSRSFYTSTQKEGPGASRHCDLRPFGEVEERVVEWRAGDSYVIEIFAGKNVPPFKKATGRLSLEAAGDASIVHFDIEYDLRFGLVGRLMDALMVRRRFEKVGPAMLGGLKRYLEVEARSHAAAPLEAHHV